MGTQEQLHAIFAKAEADVNALLATPVPVVTPPPTDSGAGTIGSDPFGIAGKKITLPYNKDGKPSGSALEILGVDFLSGNYPSWAKELVFRDGKGNLIFKCPGVGAKTSGSSGNVAHSRNETRTLLNFDATKSFKSVRKMSIDVLIKGGVGVSGQVHAADDPLGTEKPWLKMAFKEDNGLIGVYGLAKVHDGSNEKDTHLVINGDYIIKVKPTEQFTRLIQYDPVSGGAKGLMGKLTVGINSNIVTVDMFRTGQAYGKEEGIYPQYDTTDLMQATFYPM